MSLPSSAVRNAFFVVLLAVSAMLGACGGGGGDGGSGEGTPALPEPPPAANPAPTVMLDAAPRNAQPGTRAVLNWSSTNASECTAGGAWQGVKAVSGQESTEPLWTDSRFELACRGADGQTSTTASVTVVVATVQPAARFPLRVESRYLVDASGRPFLVHGDTAWSLMLQLNASEVEQYLQDRRSRGFNALLVNLIDSRFADNPPANAAGAQPFLAPGDFSQPNDAYFDFAASVLRRAEELGFVVLLVPAYLGYDGGEEGFYRDLLANSEDALRSYGRYIATKFQARQNIIWTYGGDYDPPEKRTVRPIAEGVRSVLPNSLGTAHNGPETVPAAFWQGEPWLQINNIYTLDPVYQQALTEYGRNRGIPFFLMEAAYENERGVDVRRVRSQAYYALLSGAAGHVFGNSPIWHFDAPTAPFPSPVSWTQALGQPGSVSMGHLWQIFSTREWWTLEPDGSNTMLVGGIGSGHERAVAAIAANRSFAIAYVPASRTIQLDLGRLAGPSVQAVWVEAASGTRVTANGSPFTGNGVQSLSTPQASSAGAGDWVLLLDSAAAP